MWDGDINNTLDTVFTDPLKDFDFQRTDDFWQSGDPNSIYENPAVYDPGDLVLRYLSDPVDGSTHLYIDRKYRGSYNYIKNLSWVCSWNGTYSDDDLTYYVLGIACYVLIEF